MQILHNMNEHWKSKRNLLLAIEQFHQKALAEQRYASFDFCFLYFQTHRHSLVRNKELSCLHLWSYLASWGMLRGSSQLLQECSIKALSSVVEYLSLFPDSDWDLDLGVNEKGICDESKSRRIIQIFKDLRDIMSKGQKRKASPTLITKIMLGTLGCVPAFDQYFTDAFRAEYKDTKCGFRSLTPKALMCIQNFYTENCEIINEIRYSVIDFDNIKTRFTYTRAKLIDMYGFTIGFNEAKNNSKHNNHEKEHTQI